MQEKSISHNKVNGGCESHCFKDNFIFDNSKSNKYKNIKFENNKNINSCINSNFCRGWNYNMLKLKYLIYSVLEIW